MTAHLYIINKTNCSPSTYRHISSILFCHIVDKAELRGATPNFLSKRFRTPLLRDWLLPPFTLLQLFYILFFIRSSLLVSVIGTCATQTL